MNTDELVQAKDSVVAILEKTGKKLSQFHGAAESESKSETDSYLGAVVTKLDKETEQYIYEELQKKYPNIGFRGEEHGDLNENDSDKLTWLVDPIDGTSHFVRGLPFCTTMVALIQDGEVVMSVIHDFLQNDYYWAVRGYGAFCNQEKISVIDRPMKSSIISFETNLNIGENKVTHAEVVSLAGGTFATLNCGYEFTRVASGRLDGRITKDPFGKDWDFAAGTMLVEEAGGIVKNHKSDSYSYKNHDFIASTKSVYDALIGKENSIF